MIELGNENALNERLAGRYLGVSPATLRLWRGQSRGPRFFKAGEKLIRYRRTDLDAWIEAQLIRSHSRLGRAAVNAEGFVDLVRAQRTNRLQRMARCPGHHEWTPSYAAYKLLAICAALGHLSSPCMESLIVTIAAILLFSAANSRR